MAESHPNPGQDAQKRRSTRIVQAVPLTVTGVDALGRPFQERTSTLIVNCHGARYQSKHYVLKNMWVTLEVPHNEPGHAARSVRGRVTWIQRPRTVRELFQIGVELEVGGNVWGIAFPPADWFPFPEPGGTTVTPIATPTETLQPEAEPEDWSTPDFPGPQPVQTPPPVQKAPEPVFRPPAPPAEPVLPPSVATPPALTPVERKAHAVEQPVEDNVRVLPLPGSGDASLQMARQMAKLVAEAKQQIQATARESATHAVAAETRPLLAALQAQLSDAADKSVARAVSAHLEKSQQETQRRMEAERESSIASMQQRMSGELDLRLAEARQKIDTQLADIEQKSRAEFESQLQGQVQAAIERLEGLNTTVTANQHEITGVIEQLKESSAKSAADEIQRWQQQMDQRTADAQARLAQMDQTARRLGEQIAAATALGEVGWRGLLETDLEAAHTKWREKIDAALQEASARATDQLARTGAAYGQQIEQQANLVQQTRTQMAGEIENALGSLRAAMQQEKANGDAVVAQFRNSIAALESKRHEVTSQLQSASDEWSHKAADLLASQTRELESRRNEFASLLQAASTEWGRRAESMLAAQSAEMDRRAESAVTGMAQRLQPLLESAGHDTIEKLAGEMEQRISPQIASAMDILNKLTFNREEADKAVAAYQQRVFQSSDRSLQETAARGKELLAQIEKEFSESAGSVSARWLAEIETRATDTSHSTFESLYKSADWYEKKIQAQMQSTLEKGIDLAASRLREKAAEMSGLFASELEHYSRSYVEHARGQMHEHSRDAAEIGSRQISEASDLAASKFTERAAQLGQEQLDAYAVKTKSAFEQSASHMEAHVAQVGSKLESDARNFAAEFQKALSQHGQQTLTLGKQELALQVDQAKDALLLETQSLERRFQASLSSLGSAAMDEHKQRLENASNSWLLTTVTKLNQQSTGLIEDLTKTTETRLKTVCGNVFAEMGETLRQRMAGLTAAFGLPATPEAPAPSTKSPEETK